MEKLATILILYMFFCIITSFIFEFLFKKRIKIYLKNKNKVESLYYLNKISWSLFEIIKYSLQYTNFSTFLLLPFNVHFYYKTYYPKNIECFYSGELNPNINLQELYENKEKEWIDKENKSKIKEDIQNNLNLEFFKHYK